MKNNSIYLFFMLIGFTRFSLEDNQKRSSSSLVCMPGSFYYNGTCLYFSNKNEQLPWLFAERFCRKLPFNTSLLIIDNNDKLEFVRKSLVKIKQIENPLDQLVFLIGFYQKDDAWIWTNLNKVEDYNLTIIEEWPEVNSTQGGCGSVALNKQHQVIFKSYPCLYVNSRFICEYSLNPCAAEENMCGKHGKCVNFYGKFYCDCQAVSYFHTGKYCEKLNTKAVQSIIGLCIILILLIVLIIRTITRYLNYRNRRKEEHDDGLIILMNSSTIKRQFSYTRQVSKISDFFRHKSIQVRDTIKKIGIRNSFMALVRIQFNYFKNRNRNYYNILRFLLIIILTMIQVGFIHWDNNYFRLNNLFKRNKNLQLIQNRFCQYFSKYLFEELVYSILVIGVCVCIYLCKTKRPYSYFLMRKYRTYFESKYYREKVSSQQKSINNKKKISSLNSISPTSQFSIRRRKISSAVYVIYTYDVLNVLMSIYTDNISSSLFSNFLTMSGGVIIDFLFQIIQVFFIGFKYYPILVAADLSDPSMFIYLLCMLYLAFIWLIRFFNKAVCSQKQEFARQTLVKLSSNLNEKIMNGIKFRYNVTNKLLGLFTDEPDPNEQYIKAIKFLVPKIFKESFGKYEPNEIDSYKNVILIDSLSTPNNFYIDSFTTKNFIGEKVLTSTTTTTSRDRFRDMVKNKTDTKIDSLIEELSERFDQKWKFSISFMENLPLYISLSYLLTQFSLMFLSLLLDKLIELFNKRVSRRKLNEKIHQISDGKRVIFKNMNSNDTQNDVDNEYFEDSDKINPENQIIEKDLIGFNQYKREINHNYEYIRRILKKLKLFDFSTNINLGINNGNIERKKQKSYFIHLFEKYFYKNKRYFKYSKQFVNTITVAVMIIYFFDLYIIKLSDTLCDLLARLVNFLLKYLFSGIIQSKFNVDQNHNFKTEFRIACSLTTLIILVQLFQTVRKFHDDLIKTHKFSNLSYLMENYSKYYKKLVRKKNLELFKQSVINESLHFSGFLIAHVCYGYVVIFLAIFFLTVCFKFLYYFPTVHYTIGQCILPIIIIILLRYFLIDFLVKFLFTNDDNRLFKIAPYYIASYFNFFFDCFLGLATCLSRAWLTNIVSFLTLSRIDVGMFNPESSSIINLDRAHLCYKSYVKMEHVYNNPTLIGFCELLIDSSIQSNMIIMNLKYKNNMINKFAIAFRNSLLNDDDNDYKERRIFVTEQSKTPSVILDSDKDSIRNEEFKFKSYLRLRNLLYLCLLLKKYPKLANCRYRNLVIENTNQNSKLFEEVESKENAIKRLLPKKILNNIFRLKNKPF